MAGRTSSSNTGNKRKTSGGSAGTRPGAKSGARSGGSAKANTKSGTKQNTKSRRVPEPEPEEDEDFLVSEISIIAVFAVSVLLFLSNFHLCGKLGDTLRSVQLGVFGMIGYLFPLLLFAGTCFLLANLQSVRARFKMIAVVLGLCVLCGLAELMLGAGYTEGQKISEIYARCAQGGMGGGALGGFLVMGIGSVLGTIGAYLILFVGLVISVVCITEKSVVSAVKRGGGRAYQYAREDADRRRVIHEEKKEERRRLREEKKVRGVNLNSTKLEQSRQEEEADEGTDGGAEEEAYADGGSAEKRYAGGSGEAYDSGEEEDAGIAETGGAVQIPEVSRKTGRGGKAREKKPAPREFDPELGNQAFMDELLPDSYKNRNRSVRDQADVFTGNITRPPAYIDTEDDTAPFDAENVRVEELSGTWNGPEKEPDDRIVPLHRQEEDPAVMYRGDDYEPSERRGREELPAAGSRAERYRYEDVTRKEDGSRGHAGEAGGAFDRETGRYAEEANGSFGDGDTEETGSGQDLEFGVRYAQTDDWAASGRNVKTGAGYGAEETFRAGEEDDGDWQEVSVGGPPEENGGGQNGRVSGERDAGRTLTVEEGTKRVVTTTGKIIESDTELLQKKLEEKRREAAEEKTGGVSVQAEKKPAVKKEYVFPPLNLLKREAGKTASQSDKEYRETAIKLQQTLRDFGVGVTVTNVSCGPSVTRYELHPEQGVKVSRIVGLADDIKLSLAAADIRIEAPIPGKSAVGIEVPNKEKNAVYLRELLEDDAFKNSESRLTFAVGKDIGGQVIVADIARMPHLLIAGATGSGKSVCINTLIMSILYKSSPDDVKLIMVDPKVVELSVYNGIPHLLIPVVTDPKKASGALNWAVAEMEDRYKKFAQYNVRDLKGYNAKVAAIGDVEDENKPVKLPQIVIIIDELADLMMVAPGEVEDSICRLAQLARAAGIHLVIATQRPSVNVITGLIKANVPSRIAFAVSSGVDSRTILDMVGAEKLLGKGDMLFYPSGIPKPLRVQGAFVSDSEVSQVAEFLKQQGLETEADPEIESRIAMSQGASPRGGSDRDEYFAQAGRFIIEKEKASIGNVQRMFKIGFNRAARIMDQLAEAGVVSDGEGTKPRQILMTLEEFDAMLRDGR